MDMLFMRKQEVKAPWYLLLLIIVVGTGIYFLSQRLIGGLQVSPCLIEDRLVNLLGGFNQYLNHHPTVADAVIILYSGIGDLYILFFIGYSIWMRSLRSILPFFAFFFLRQILQCLVTLPSDPNLIWHYPGFPALFANYRISSDFYFSAYVGMNLLVTLELLKYRIHWLTILGFFIVFLEAFIDLILQTHYTTDLYTSIMTAIVSYVFFAPLADKIDVIFKKKYGERHSRVILGAILLIGFIIYNIGESWIGDKPPSSCGIIDQLHQWTLSLNAYITQSMPLQDALLIVLNAIVDSSVIFVFLLTLIRQNIRPFLTLGLFFVLRQSLQLLVSLPIPAHTIWHYPGFPSLLATYNIGNDFYFSGHTGISLIAALELMNFHKHWLTICAFTIFGCILITLIVMEIHYTMDIYTAILTVFCLTKLSQYIAPPINRWLRQLV
jgi:hypothetical protein